MPCRDWTPCPSNPSISTWPPCTTAMATSGQPVIYVKGAVEKVLARSARTRRTAVRSTPRAGGGSRQQAHDMASEGLRVLAFARKDLPSVG